MNKIRILYIHQYFSTRLGTTGTRSYEFSKYFISKGHDVTVITSNFALNSIIEIDRSKFIQKINIEGINLIIINIKYSNYMNYHRRIFSFILFTLFSSYMAIKQKNIDVVFSTSTPLTIGIPGILLSRLKKIPFVFEIRDLWPDIPIAIGAIKNKLLITLARYLEKICYREAKKIIVLSKGMLEFLKKRKVPLAKLIIIPNCADLELFKPEKKNNELRKVFNLEHKFIAIHSGAMGYVNGLEIVVNSAKILKEKKENNIVFLLIGDGKEKQRLKQLVKLWGLKNVLILDAVPREKLPEILATANLGLMLVRNIKIFETNSANKFFDYLSAGKPILVNYGGWMKEVLEHYKAGVSVEPDNPRAMVETILKLKDDPKWCEEMGRNARKLAEDKFDRIKLTKRLEKIFDEVINERINKKTN